MQSGKLNGHQKMYEAQETKPFSENAYDEFDEGTWPFEENTTLTKGLKKWNQKMENEKAKTK